MTDMLVMAVVSATAVPRRVVVAETSASVHTSRTVLNCVALFQGSVNAAQVRVAEVFKEAVRANCPAIAITYNNPGEAIATIAVGDTVMGR